MAEKGPSKGQKSKFRKTKNCVFFSCPKEYYAKKLGSQVKNSDLQRANTHTYTHTHRQTEISITEDTIRASVFKASASGMSGPILENGRKRALKGLKIKISKNKKKYVFFSCPKESYAKKLGSQVKNSDLQRANRQTHTQTHTQTEISITEDTIRASVFKASASGMSGPIIIVLSTSDWYFGLFLDNSYSVAVL